MWNWMMMPISCEGFGLHIFPNALSDVLELDSVLYVPELTRSLLSVSCMTNLKCLAEFDGQQVTIRDNIHGSS